MVFGPLLDPPPSPSRQMSHVANVAPPYVAFRRPVVWHCDESRVGPIPGSAKMTIWTNASPTKKFIDRRYIQQIGKNSICRQYSIIEGSLGVNLPTYGQMQQQWWEHSEKRKRHKRKSRERSRCAKRQKSRETRFSNVLWLWKVQKQAR